MKRFLYFRPELCSACGACAVACIDQNDIALEQGETPYRRAFTVETDFVAYYSVSCMHCKDAPCVMACPVGCLTKDEETGYTLYDSSGCIGCHSCSMACPFGIPSFDVNGRMHKCDACAVRQKYGYKPACVKVCPVGALTLRSEEEYQAECRAMQEKKCEAMLEEQRKNLGNAL